MEESTFQLGGVESAVRSFASYHYCFSESYGISMLFINNKNCTWDLGMRWGGGGGGGSRAYG